MQWPQSGHKSLNGHWNATTILCRNLLDLKKKKPKKKPPTFHYHYLESFRTGFFKEAKWDKGQKLQNALRVPPFEGRLKRPYWKRTLLKSCENLNNTQRPEKPIRSKLYGIL